MECTRGRAVLQRNRGSTSIERQAAVSFIFGGGDTFSVDYFYFLSEVTSEILKCK